MKAADLRKSILQAAVQGKLVPQDKNDEPASELLKRIQAEKAALVKEGKLKKERPLPLITEDEIPYDLPEGWEWCRLGTICLKLTDGTHSTPTYTKTGIPFLSVKDVSTGNINFSAVKFISETEHMKLYKRCNPQSGDILLTKVGTTGIPVIVDTDTEFSLFVSVALLKLSKTNCCLEYLKYLIQSPLVQIQAQENTRGVGNKNWVLTAISNTIIVIPPLTEQQRIVTKVDELMALCDELEAAEKELNALENHFAEYLPKSILQAAVQGKLVTQDKDDEPASELLKRIQAEKATLIKEGKLKKEKPLPPITEDEIPYDLPEGWEWCRLSDIGEIVSGATPDSMNADYYTNPTKGIPWITPADMKNSINNYISRGTKDITQAGYNSCSTTLLPPGSVIFSSRAPIGHIAFAQNELCTNQGFKSLDPYEFKPASWIFYVLKSKVSDINSRASGTTFKEVSGKFMSLESFPLPPLAEQQRIVAKVDELMALCDELKYVDEQPIDHSNNIISFPAKPETEDSEPIRMAAQGKVEVQPSKQHEAALDDLLEMMDDD